MTAAAVTVRPYAPADLGACLALFDSNLPRFFAPGERPEFQAFLSPPAPPTLAPYLVLEQSGRPVACGGLSIDPPARRASLTWGMVDRARQGQGLGRRLTEARLDLARALPGLNEVILATSPLTLGFYARFGFVPTGCIPDGFGPGLDRWDMVLRLAPQ